MRVGRIGADHHDDVGLLDAVEILRACRGAEGLAQSVSGRRMADPGAGIGVVVAERRAGQLLHQIGFLVGAARRRDDADRVLARLRLDTLELRGNPLDRHIPTHFPPGIGDLLADHRLQDAVAMLRVSPGEAALDAGVPVIRLAVLPRHHAHHLIATHLRLEVAPDPAVGAGRDDRVLRLAHLHDRFFHQRRSRAGLHARAAGDAFAGQERLIHPRRHLGREPAPLNGQREGALHFLAGPHAARADDALRRIEVEIRVGPVDRRGQMILALIAVAHVAQPNLAGRGLQFTIAVGGAGQAVQRMIGDVQLHHPPPQRPKIVADGVHLHARRDRGGTGGRRAAAPLDLDQAQAATAEAVQHVGGTQPGDLDAGFHRGAHDGGALRHRHIAAVNRQGHRSPNGHRGGWCTVVDLLHHGHRRSSPSIRQLNAGRDENLPGKNSSRSAPGRG